MTGTYGREVQELGKTYGWSLDVPINGLVDLVRSCSEIPFYAVGSGGSYTAATMASLLHQFSSNMCGTAVTPLQLISLRMVSPASSVYLFSASGQNADIVSAFRFAAASDVQQIVSICMRTQSILAKLSGEYSSAAVIEYDLLRRRDGFLATNSLLATLVLLIRAYAARFSTPTWILPELFFDAKGLYEELETGVEMVLQRDTWSVLYSGWSYPVAEDIESRFTEAALKNIQIADYRNFGHGRHNWIAKRGDETGVIALVTPVDRPLAEKTIRLLPRTVPVYYVETKRDGPVGALELLIKILHLVDIVGKAKSVDPGKPRVPKFGRQLYHLRIPIRIRTPAQPKGIRQAEAVAILRKTRVASLDALPNGALQFWREAYRNYRTKISEARYGGLVFDYDGTLCDRGDRFKGLSSAVSTELIRLLSGGVYIGVATGRGQSVRVALQNAISKMYWNRVTIGYYNGAVVAPLTDRESPDKTSPLHPHLKSVLSALDGYGNLINTIKYEVRPKQISIEPADGVSRGFARSAVLDAIINSKLELVRIVESSRSIDVIAPGVSKRKVVQAIQSKLQEFLSPTTILSFGDQGEWPGNDHELLSLPYSLSVDVVSPNPESGWNLSPPGYRGTQSLIAYLRNIRIINRNLGATIKV